MVILMLSMKIDIMITEKTLKFMTYQYILKATPDGDVTNSFAIKQFYQKHSNVHTSVLNALLIHCMRLHDGRIPNIGYLEKTLATWKNREPEAITTPKRAVAFMNNHHDFMNKKKEKNKNRPSWLTKEYMDEMLEM